MKPKTVNLNNYIYLRAVVFFLAFCSYLLLIPSLTVAEEKRYETPSNFGLPGLIDLPSGRRFTDGQLGVTQQNHRSIWRSGISFQALPRLGLSFRYTGHGIGGQSAYGRVNYDRSFDAHISVLDEGRYAPSLSFGLRDFIGTGWYSSEYIVGTKTIGNFEITAGLGFGRLAGKNSFSNPLRHIYPKLEVRGSHAHGRGGTFGNINWFQGDTSLFYGISYSLGKNFKLLSEYTPDLMSRENSYLNLKSPWNFGLTYELNKYASLSLQYLHGNQVSITSQVFINPNEPPLAGGKELAPVPMRLRDTNKVYLNKTNENVIRKVLMYDKFKIHSLRFENDIAVLHVTNTKFRSNIQALGRIASTLQRFTSDKISYAYISFYNRGLQAASYKVNLDEITKEQFNPRLSSGSQTFIMPVESKPLIKDTINKKSSWGIGPYIEHRFFDPDQPLSLETGLEIKSSYRIYQGLELSGSVRKSVLTTLTKNKRLNSHSPLPRVHSDWPLYDIGGQNGHIYDFKLSYVKNLGNGFFGRVQAGLLEPFFAGFGGEFLYKPNQSPFAFGIDVHRVQQRDYDMRFKLREYETTVGHMSIYYDAGGMFDVEVNVGRYLAGDWGATTTISRKFGSGWEVGGYATFTDVPFDTFGEGSFDKAIYVSLPLDWIISSPNKARRRLALRPITRDGGANMLSSRRLYRLLENYHSASFKREYGRLWK